MKKILTTIGVGLIILLGWLTIKPESQIAAKPTPTPPPTYFAEIDENGIVLRVIVIRQKDLNTGRWGDPANWIETTTDGSKRKNYAGIGYKYDKDWDAFIAPKPKNAIGFDEEKAQWITTEDGE